MNDSLAADIVANAQSVGAMMPAATVLLRRAGVPEGVAARLEPAQRLLLSALSS